MRQQALLQPHDKHHRKLQPLGLVQSNQGHGVFRFLVAVGVGNQGNPFQQGRQAILRGFGIVFPGQGDKLPEIIQSFLRVVVASLDLRFQARLGQHQLNQVHHRHFGLQLGQATQQVAEPGHGGIGAGNQGRRTGQPGGLRFGDLPDGVID